MLCSRPHRRNYLTVLQMVALFAWWVNIGSILGGTVNKFTKVRLDKSSYQIPLGCLYIVPTVLAIGLFFVPESPRFLLHKGKEAEAKRALIYLRGSALTKEELEFEWAEMLRGLEEEKKNARSVAWMDMFRGTLLLIQPSSLTASLLTRFHRK